MNARTPTQHLTAREFCAKLRTEDLNANNAIARAHNETVQACTRIRCIPQVWEEDALLLLHTTQVMVEKNSNNHMQLWQDVCELLSEAQAVLQKSIDENRTEEAARVTAAGCTA